jgi:hypothetical protein
VCAARPLVTLDEWAPQQLPLPLHIAL